MVKKWGKLIVLLGIVLAILYCFYFYRVRSIANAENSYNEILISSGELVSQEQYDNNTVIEQYFHSERSCISGFQIMFRKLDGEEDSIAIKVEFEEKPGSLIEEWLVVSDDIVDGEYQYFQLSTPLTESYNKDYVIRVTAQNLGSVAPAVVENNNFTNLLYVDGEKETGKNFVYSLRARNTFLKQLYIIFSVIVLAGTFVFYWMISLNCKKVESYFLLLGLVWGSLFTLMFPPSSTPDEHSHIVKAYQDADVLMFKDPIDEDGNVLVRKTEAEVENYFSLSLAAYSYYYDASKKTTDSSITSYDMTGILAMNMSVAAHLPQVIGVVIGRLLQMNGVATLYLGMFAGLFFYLACCYWAIKWIPWGKEVLMLISLFPMCLELAGSFSYDCMIIAVSYMIIGYTMKLIYEKPTVGWRDYILLAVLIAWMAPCKIVYILIAGIVFAIPNKKSGNRKKAISGKAMAIGLGIFAIVAERLGAFYLTSMNKTATGTSYEIEQFTLKQIVMDPIHSVGMLFNTWFDQSEHYLRTIVGGSLGWFQVEISWVIICGFIILVILALANDELNFMRMTWNQKSLIYILSILMLGAIVLAMWLGFTPTSLECIAGVQGRYLLPFIPLVVLTLKNGYIVVKKNISQGIIIAAFVLELLTIFDVWKYAVR